MRKVGFILLALFSFVGIAAAEQVDDILSYNNPSSLEERNLIFDLNQKVTGTGFFAAYKYSLMPDALGTQGRLFNGVEAKGNAHGSGKIDMDSMMHAESSYTNKTWVDGALDDDDEIVWDEEEATSIIQMKDDGEMTYSPTAMGIGTQYYNIYPIFFNSLLKEEAWVKNRDGLNSLYHSVDKARGLNIALNAQSDATNSTMNVEEDLIDGRAHFGALQLAGIPVDEEPEEGDFEETSVPGFAMKAWKKPLIELDEEYVGTFHIRKNMALHTYSEEKEKEEAWLPCCSGDWFDMKAADKKSFGASAGGIFDYTRLQVPDRELPPG